MCGVTSSQAACRLPCLSKRRTWGILASISLIVMPNFVQAERQLRGKSTTYMTNPPGGQLSGVRAIRAGFTPFAGIVVPRYLPRTAGPKGPVSGDCQDYHGQHCYRLPLFLLYCPYYTTPFSRRP